MSARAHVQTSRGESDTLIAVQPVSVLAWSYIKHNAHNIRHMKVQSNDNDMNTSKKIHCK